MDKKKIYNAANADDLNSILEEIHRGHPNSKLLFRGQIDLYESIKSSRMRQGVELNREVDAGWRALALRMLGLTSNAQYGSRVKAILQHYGMHTHFVDLTENINVAAWFATHQYFTETYQWIGNGLRTVETAGYRKSEKAYGYILILSFDDVESLKKKDWIFDLSSLSKDFLRPHRQAGWLLLDRPPFQPNPDMFWIATIKILDPSLWKSDLSTLLLFPKPEEDPAFEVLLSLPYVQIPLDYYKNDETSPEEDSGKRICTARRAISVLEYEESESSECIDHKWNDITIYEPHPMRMWKYWSFELNDRHDGIEGNIRDAVKITLTPDAKDILLSEAHPVCRWPDFSAAGIFFTFAQLDHDKVIEHAPPYHGVWLQRDDDCIIETTMQADEETLTVGGGHVYLFRDGQLKRYDTENSCACGAPESHDIRVFGMLQLTRLIEVGVLILLPHPTLSKLGWYIVITGEEAHSMIPKISPFREVLRRIVRS